LAPPVGVVTGIAAEARAIAGARAGDRGVLIRCSGPGIVRADRAAQSLLSDGAGALLSFGLAGGLRRGLVPGSVIVAHKVLGPDGESHASDRHWHARLLTRLIGDYDVLDGALYGASDVIHTRAEKAALAETTGAAAVDMESLGIARAAATAGVPFLAIRAIADPVHRTVPAAALAGLGPDGEIRVVPVLKALLRRPYDLPALLRLSIDTAVGLKALGRVVALAGPTLAVSGLGEE